MKSCNPLGWYHRFGRTSCLHLHDSCKVRVRRRQCTFATCHTTLWYSEDDHRMRQTQYRCCLQEFVGSKLTTLKWFSNKIRAVPVVARSKTWVCGSLLAGIVGSNPARGMDVSVVNVVCCQVAVSATTRTHVERSTSECDVCI